ncbi:MAG: bifunctional nuclease family protein [Acidobacteriota bacterium]|nr:bifunctional nuclease family protein [Acidobacteriota bacterium]
MQIEVKIRGLMVDPHSGTPVVILKDVHSDMLLPIWVGAYEANAIALEIEKVAPQRPMTHDLIRNLITEMGIQVERVVVTELRDSTFYAVIEMRNTEGETLFIDARPSDAIALALRADCPIFVNDEVFRVSNRKDEEETEETAESGDEEWPDVIGEVGDLPM